MLKLTICGSFQRKDLGKAVGVDVKRATGQVPKGDLEKKSSKRTNVSVPLCLV